MIIVLKKGASEKKVQELQQWLAKYPVRIVPIVGEETTVWGLVGDTTAVDRELVDQNEAVDRVIKVQEPYKLANRRFNAADTVIRVGDCEIGGPEITVMAGPCSVESEEQVLSAAREIKKSGAQILRGGAFKPRSSPYSFQGLKAEGLMLLKKAREQYGMPIVSEITSPFYIEMFEQYVDIIQVGARNMQNFELLKELGRVKKPILIKRGFSNTLEELLMSAEYVMNEGNSQVILCERGIRTYETYTRNTLDISAVPALKRMSHLPVVVDPSHASGKAWMVEPLALAAVAAGADGLIVEVHPDPAHALSDGAQSLNPEQFAHMMGRLRPIAEAVGRRLRPEETLGTAPAPDAEK